MPPMPKTPWRGTFARPARISRFLAFAVQLLTMHHCDRCGYDKDGLPIAKARFRVVTPAGELHFCGHHFRKHRAHIHERAYETYEVR